MGGRRGRIGEYKERGRDGTTPELQLLITTHTGHIMKKGGGDGIVSTNKLGEKPVFYMCNIFLLSVCVSVCFLSPSERLDQIHKNEGNPCVRR